MTITTRTIAKGIPARLCEPKPKGKPPATKSNAKAKPTTKESRKRATREDESEEESEPASDDSLHRAKEKRDGKRRRIELSEAEGEVDVVEDIEPPEEDVEEVDDGIGKQRSSNKQDVSAYHLLQASKTHYTLG